ncbi:MAG: hypothetical protein QOJ99_5444, partial [Bryobacterales bacterium]|nr:hypothetical protein [Bryobacterales bacterium]
LSPNLGCRCDCRACGQKPSACLIRCPAHCVTHKHRDSISQSSGHAPRRQCRGDLATCLPKRQRQSDVRALLFITPIIHPIPLDRSKASAYRLAGASLFILALIVPLLPALYLIRSGVVEKQPSAALQMLPNPTTVPSAKQVNVADHPSALRLPLQLIFLRARARTISVAKFCSGPNLVFSIENTEILF